VGCKLMMGFHVPIVGWGGDAADPTIYDAVTPTDYSGGENSSGWAGYTLRTTCMAGEVSNQGKLFARVRFRAATNQAYPIVNAYLGHQAPSGDQWDFES